MSQIKLPKENIVLDHVDIVTSHMCNNRCKHCIDKFIRTSTQVISLETIEKFLDMIRTYTNKKLEVLLLGGEPTLLATEKLISIAELVHSKGFLVMMTLYGQAV